MILICNFTISKHSQSNWKGKFSRKCQSLKDQFLHFTNAMCSVVSFNICAWLACTESARKNIIILLFRYRRRKTLKIQLNFSFLKIEIINYLQLFLLAVTEPNLVRMWNCLWCGPSAFVPMHCGALASRPGNNKKKGKEKSNINNEK